MGSPRPSVTCSASLVPFAPDSRSYTPPTSRPDSAALLRCDELPAGLPQSPRREGEVPFRALPLAGSRPSEVPRPCARLEARLPPGPARPAQRPQPPSLTPASRAQLAVLSPCPTRAPSSAPPAAWARPGPARPALCLSPPPPSPRPRRAPASAPALAPAEPRLPRSAPTAPSPPATHPARRPRPRPRPSAAFKLYKVPLSRLGGLVSLRELGAHRCPQLQVRGEVRPGAGGSTAARRAAERSRRHASGPRVHLEGSAGDPSFGAGREPQRPPHLALAGGLPRPHHPARPRAGPGGIMRPSRLRNGRGEAIEGTHTGRQAFPAGSVSSLERRPLSWFLRGCKLSALQLMAPRLVVKEEALQISATRGPALRSLRPFAPRPLAPCPPSLSLPRLWARLKLAWRGDLPLGSCAPRLKLGPCHSAAPGTRLIFSSCLWLRGVLGAQSAGSGESRGRGR